jgi:putative phosphoribosyl transferase
VNAGSKTRERSVELDAGGVGLSGDLALPEPASALVLFAHGSGSSRRSPRNRQVAGVLNEAGLATLLFDLLSEAEAADRGNVFDISLLGERLATATRWALEQDELAALPIGYFGASTGAAAALVASVALGDRVRAIVSRGGRPDLAGDALPPVTAPTLLLVGGADELVIELNRQAQAQMNCETRLVVVPGATHLFEEAGALEAVAAHAVRWLRRHLVHAAAA